MASHFRLPQVGNATAAAGAHGYCVAGPREHLLRPCAPTVAADWHPGCGRPSAKPPNGHIGGSTEFRSLALQVPTAQFPATAAVAYGQCQGQRCHHIPGHNANHTLAISDQPDRVHRFAVVLHQGRTRQGFVAGASLHVQLKTDKAADTHPPKIYTGRQRVQRNGRDTERGKQRQRGGDKH